MFTCIHIYTHVYTYIHSIRLPIYTSSRQLPLLKQPYICITHTFLYVYAFYTHMYVCAIYIHMYTPVLTHTYMQSIYTYTCNLYVQSICAIYIHLLIERTPPPRGVFLFTLSPDQEPGGRGPSSKHLVQILRRGSSSFGFLIREQSK